MNRTVKAAAIQMKGQAAPTEEKLQQAQQLVETAVQQGANLILLPELFNTGYSYSEANFQRAERINGRTATWLRETAAAHNIHLAGSLLLLDDKDIYNSLLLFAPDGRMWRYDKNYPWGWERGYFRGGSGVTIANTDLGRIGMLICWDVGHANLWKQYAGQVDLMLISSCPPNLGQLALRLPNGRLFNPGQLTPMVAEMNDQADKAYGTTLNEQVGWLNVPALHASTSGPFQSAVPYAKASLLVAAPIVPDALRMLPQANLIQIVCDFVGHSKILDNRGQIISQITAESEEAVITADITTVQSRPQPNRNQPPINLLPATYAFSDYILPWLTTPLYRRSLRQTWGQHIVPITTTPRQRTIGLLVASSLFLLIIYLLGRRK